MRVFDYSGRDGQMFLYGWNKQHFVYNDVEEALLNGIPREDIIHWKESKLHPEWVGKYLISDDTIVPDYWDGYESCMINLKDPNGLDIPTTGCVVQMLAYKKGKTEGEIHKNDWLITSTGACSYLSKEMFTCRKRNFWSFGYPTGKRTVLGLPDRISKKKMAMAAEVLGMDSPTFGKPVAVLLKYYPHYKRYSEVYQLKIALDFFAQEWFKRLLIKKGFLMAINKPLQQALLDNKVNWDLIGKKIKHMLDNADPDKGLGKAIDMAISMLKANDEDAPMGKTTLVDPNKLLEPINPKRITTVEDIENAITEGKKFSSDVVVKEVTKDQIEDLAKGEDYPESYVDRLIDEEPKE